MNWRVSVLQVIAGQAIWALAQGGIVLLLAYRGEFALIGFYVLGLSIMTPLCLLGGLNLRVLVALDDKASIAPRTAILLRSVVALLALGMTALALFILAPTGADALSATLLVSTRLADQISDLTNGYHQSKGNQRLIARSFFLRGLAVLLPFFVFMMLSLPMISIALACAASTLLVSLLADVMPLLSSEREPARISAMRLIRTSLALAPYPVLDALHMNSFRYAIFFTCPVDFLGLVGVAQTLYVPFQLVGTALGYPFLPRARALAETHSPDYFRFVWLGVATGLALGLAFLIGAVLIPAELLTKLFGARGNALLPVLMLVGIAMLPMLATGFIALSLVARGANRRYLSAPLLGLALFWGGFVVLFLVTPGISPEMITGLFCLAGFARLLIALPPTLSPLSPGARRS